MTLNYKNILALTVLLAVVGIFSIIWQKPWQASGSVMPRGEYLATTTVGMLAVHNPITANLSGNSGVLTSTLGSIIVASSSATTFTIWNATSTTDIASTSVVTLKASIGEGAYTFDSELPRGLVVVKPAGFNGDYVITYRRQ